MFSMFGVTRKKRIVAVADIGSGSAACAIVEIHPHGPAIVLESSRMTLPIEERTTDASIAGIMGKLVEAGNEVLKSYSAKHANGMPHIDSVHAVIRAPWTSARSLQAATTFDKPTVVTAVTIDKLAKEALARIGTADKSDFLDAGVVRVQLDGYPTKHPVGKRVRQVVVTVVVSACDVAMKSAAEKALGNVFPHVPITMRSSTRATLAVLRETLSIPNYLVIDMGSTGTSMAVVRNGVASEQAIVQDGIHTILKRSANGLIPEETLTLIRMLSRGHCDDDACKKFEASFAAVEPEIVRIMGEALSALSSTDKLPNRLILVAHPDVAPWLSKFFSRIDFAQFTETFQPFSVATVTPRDMSSLVEPGPHAAVDCAICIAAAVVNIETQSR
jgi:hypothetical protein